MADNANCLHAGVEIGHQLNTFESPVLAVHESVLLGKRICAKQNCITQRAFFHENGILQHYRFYYEEFIARVQSMAFTILNSVDECSPGERERSSSPKILRL